MTTPLLWQGPLFDYLSAGGEVSEWADVGGVQVANHFKKEGNPAQLALVDLSHLPRIGVKGRDWSFLPETMQSPEVNTVLHGEDGGLLCCLGGDELLLLSDERGGHLIEVPTQFALPRQDSHCWFGLCGEQVPALLSRICAIPAPVGNVLLQTMVVGIGGIVLPALKQSVPSYYLITDNGYAVYVWKTLLRIIASLNPEGGVIGWDGWSHCQ